ncbi:MAG: ABC-F family ATP-binding cassette domain-containing protein [Calditrichota bacterium]
MSLLRLNNLSMSFGGQTVFEGLNAAVNAGDHIGLVGPNGAGKTTLLRLIKSELEPKEGHIAQFPGLKIGYLPQNPVYPPEQTVFTEVYSGFGDLKEIESELRFYENAAASAEAEGSPDLERLALRYADLLDRFQMRGGAEAESKAAAMLKGLGLPERIWFSPMNTLSGGERNLVGLARILVSDHDVMLLDEPGNHLDFSGLEWLENYLSHLPEAFIIVSHHRYTLDRVCRRIWELDRGRLEQYTGNYSSYRAEKLTRQLAQEAAYRRAQKEISRLEFNIQRLKAWSSVYDNPKLARTARVFEKRVGELENIEKPTSDKTFKFRLLTKPPQGRIAIEAKNYRKQFDEEAPLLDDVHFLIAQGERIAFVGDNGTGKTSLMKDIVEIGRWENPVLRVGKSVRLAYYSQLGENLTPRASLVDEAMRLTGFLKGEASELLHRFMFTRDDLEKTVQVLSGGETARLQLAALVVSGADMLLLDEPTNHLDIASREAVEDALEEYPGTLVVISHDRYFLDKLADRVFYFEPPHLIEYEGNFSEFWEKKKKNEVQIQTSSKRPNLLRRRSPQDTKEPPSKKKVKLQRLKFDPQRFRELEAEIARLEELRPAIQDELRQLEAKGKDIRAERRRIRLTELDRQLDTLYAEWVTLGERKRSW